MLVRHGGRKGVAVLEIGEVFAGFTVERMLGQGGMGTVYLARHPRLDRLTALKLLNRDLFADARIRARFEREADLAAGLDHPGIVTVFDRGAEGEQLWISMQYVDGIDAATVDPMTLPPERAVQIIEGVADALDYAHGRGVLHRDVKPANILLARSSGGQGERVFLTDFGIARLRADSTHLTQQGMFTATLAYASPEQMTGAELDHRSDQYSLACALYWLFTGIAPFDSPDPNEIIRGTLHLPPQPLALRRHGLPPALDAVLAAAMAKHPAARFDSCTAFAKAARKALTSNTPPVLPRPTAYYPPPSAAGPYPPAAPGYASPPVQPRQAAPPPNWGPVAPPAPAAPPRVPAAPAPPHPGPASPAPPPPGPGSPSPHPSSAAPGPQPGSGSPVPQPGSGSPVPQPGPAVPGPQPGSGSPVSQSGSVAPGPHPSPGSSAQVPSSQRPALVADHPESGHPGAYNSQAPVAPAGAHQPPTQPPPVPPVGHPQADAQVAAIPAVGQRHSSAPAGDAPSVAAAPSQRDGREGAASVDGGTGAVGDRGGRAESDPSAASGGPAAGRLGTAADEPAETPEPARAGDGREVAGDHSAAARPDGSESAVTDVVPMPDSARLAANANAPTTVTTIAASAGTPHQADKSGAPAVSGADAKLADAGGGTGTAADSGASPGSTPGSIADAGGASSEELPDFGEPDAASDSAGGDGSGVAGRGATSGAPGSGSAGVVVPGSGGDTTDGMPADSSGAPATDHRQEVGGAAAVVDGPPSGSVDVGGGADSGDRTATVVGGDGADGGIGEGRGAAGGGSGVDRPDKPFDMGDDAARQEHQRSPVDALGGADVPADARRGTGGPGRGAHPYPAPPPPMGRARPGPRLPVPKRMSGLHRLGWLALVGLVVALVALLVALVAVVVGGNDEDQAPDAAAAGPPSSSATTVGDSFAKSRRVFPTLVPQGVTGEGPGYRGARCFAVRSVSELEWKEPALQWNPISAGWQCERTDNNAGSVSYLVLEYPSAAHARSVVEALPAAVRYPGDKDGVEFDLRRWVVPDPSSARMITAHQVIGFPEDDLRANYLIAVSRRGSSGTAGAPRPSAQDEIIAWWEDVPL
ncbi:serine/threonine-protein kinase [Nocardia neocaledoniensis]|uniref:non-specific serine/threonine protein kinase n=1 Tax=Nocardia neocaledoniensis TaxID=236511 RepID=A0A317P180_9NOCA|nr:serine/threonine-protein kinase [Nocardia neocaledoniensis]